MLSTYLSHTILNGICGNTSSNPFGSGTTFLALSSSEPHADGSNVIEPNTPPLGSTEPKNNGYSRTLLGAYNQSITQHMGTPVNGVVENTKEIHFNEATDDWGELSYICIYDAATKGRLLAWGELGRRNDDGVWEKQTIHPVANNVVVLKPGDVQISIT